MSANGSQVQEEPFSVKFHTPAEDPPFVISVTDDTLNGQKTQLIRDSAATPGRVRDLGELLVEAVEAFEQDQKGN